jgi:hypothetical protein
MINTAVDNSRVIVREHIRPNVSLTSKMLVLDFDKTLDFK